MTMTMSQGIAVSEVTDVDRRTARRLGMDAGKVNLVINTWASEYLNYERENARTTTAVTSPAKPPAAKRAKPAKSRATAKDEANAETPSEPQPNTEAQAEGNPS